MRLTTLLLPFLAAAPLLIAESKDFINFSNDDTFHGEFKGFTTSGKIIWKNESAEKNIAFDPTKVRKIVINEGKLTKPFSHSSFITLTNKDTVPGKIIAITDKNVIIKTDYAGEIKIAREQVALVDFQPLGNKIIYRGPYTKDGWKSSTLIVGKTPTKAKQPEWVFKNFSWVNNDKAALLMNELDLPDKFRLTFKTNGVNSTYPTIVLFADEVAPEAKGKKNPARGYSHNSIYKKVGTALCLGLSSYSPSLTFNSFTEEGIAVPSTLPNRVQYRRSMKIGAIATFDVRFDKENNSIYVYIDKTLIGQWDLTNVMQKMKGKKMGIANLYGNRGNKIVVNEIVLSAWNGVKAPANSVENKDRDIVLLTNGTDRYSGKIKQIDDDKLKLKSAYADLAIPLGQIRSLNFATKHLSPTAKRKQSEAAVRFYGTGKITGLLSRGKDGTVILENPIMGKITLQSEFISAYEFENLDHLYDISH